MCGSTEKVSRREAKMLASFWFLVLFFSSCPLYNSKGFQVLDIVPNGPDSIMYDVPIDNNTPWTIGDEVKFTIPLSARGSVDVIGAVNYVKNFNNDDTQIENIFISGTVPSVESISSAAGTFSASFYSNIMTANIQYPGDIQFELRTSSIQRTSTGFTKTYVMTKVDMYEKYYSKDREESIARKHLMQSQSKSHSQSVTDHQNIFKSILPNDIDLKATPNLNVLMIYTKQAVNAIPGGENSLLSEISLAIGNFNLALQNSGVDMSVTYVAERMQEYDTYVESADFGTMLSQMGSTIDISRRNLFSCHAVQLIVANNQYCGIGWYTDNGIGTQGESVAMWDCIGGYMTAAHEIGHNMGLAHDVSVSPVQPGDTVIINHGYCWDDAGGSNTCHRSVMSYAQCVTPNGRTNCAKAKYFSNPYVSEMGNPVGNAEFANNAQQLRNNMNGFLAQFVPSFSPGATISPSYSLKPSRAPTLAPSFSPVVTGLLLNPGFETDLSGWGSSGTTSFLSSQTSGSCRTGTGCAMAGATTATNLESVLMQTFTVAAGQTQLSFWYKMTCPDTVTYDWATATLLDRTTSTTTIILPKICTTNSWTRVTATLTPGRTYTLSLINRDDNWAADPTYTLFDDVELLNPSTASSYTPSFSPINVPTKIPASVSPSIVPTTKPSITPSFSPTSIPTVAPSSRPTNSPITPGDITNFATWTQSGALTSIVTTGCMVSGGSCAKAGSDTPTNGESRFSTTFTPSAGQTQFSFWYKMTCFRDSVSYDWVTATLVDTTTSTTSTILPRECTNNAWKEVTTAIIPGRSYTITLISKDDNYAGDASYTLFDDPKFLVSPPTLSPSFVPSLAPVVVLSSKTPSLAPSVPIVPGDITNFATWTQSGALTSIVTTGCMVSGGSCAKAGSDTPTNGESRFSTTFTPSAGQTQFSFWYKMTCFRDDARYDWVTSTLVDTTTSTTSTILPRECTNNAWKEVTTAIIPGRSYTITLISKDDNYAGDASYTLFDGVSLSFATASPSYTPSLSPTIVPSYVPSAIPSITPTVNPTLSGLSNPGFEEGLSSWTSSGTASLVSTGCYGGVGNCAMLGAITPTDGDSKLMQPFVPSGSMNQLSFWYKMNCPSDSADFDWATATLIDETANTKKMIMTKVCSVSTDWLQVITSVIPGHSYKLILINHDDNYIYDPSYTLFDKVRLETVTASSDAQNLGSSSVSKSNTNQMVAIIVGVVLGMFFLAGIFLLLFVYRHWYSNKGNNKNDLNMDELYVDPNYYTNASNTMINPSSDTTSISVSPHQSRRNSSIASRN